MKIKKRLIISLIIFLSILIFAYFWGSNNTDSVFANNELQTITPYIVTTLHEESTGYYKQTYDGINHKLEIKFNVSDNPTNADFTIRYGYGPNSINKIYDTDSGLTFRAARTLHFYYEIIASSGNFNECKGNFSVCIEPMKIKYQINNLSSIYGDDILDFSGQIIEGTVFNNENLRMEFKPEFGEKLVPDVGIYEIDATSLNTNYDVTILKGSYEITKRTLNLVINDHQIDTRRIKYKVSDFVKYAYNLVNIDNVNNIGIKINCEANSKSKSGNYKVTFYSECKNYNVNFDYSSAEGIKIGDYNYDYVMLIIEDYKFPVWLLITIPIIVIVIMFYLYKFYLKNFIYFKRKNSKLEKKQKLTQLSSNNKNIKSNLNQKTKNSNTKIQLNRDLNELKNTQPKVSNNTTHLNQSNAINNLNTNQKSNNITYKISNNGTTIKINNQSNANQNKQINNTTNKH